VARNEVNTPVLADADVYYAIFLTPDCDLLQAFKARRGSAPSHIVDVLLFAVEASQTAKDRLRWSTKEWSHVAQNEVDRFYFLKEIPSREAELPDGIPDLVVDFKKYFTLPPQEIYQQINDNSCRRLVRLYDLWREDLQRRAMSYMQRVALPDPSDV
jgi:hypothetical protein